MYKFSNLPNYIPSVVPALKIALLNICEKSFKKESMYHGCENIAGSINCRVQFHTFS